MNRFKFDEFHVEFPFLHKLDLRDASWCQRIRIARLDEMFLRHVPQRSETIGSMVGIDDDERIDFVLQDGSVIKCAVAQKHTCSSNYAHDDGFSDPGETVLEAIYKHGIVHTEYTDLAFVVAVHSGYDVCNHYSTDCFYVTIYKTTKSVDLADMIFLEKTKAIQEIKAEAKF